MTTCLRCDGCSKAVAEHEGDLRSWWRLTRYGVDWPEEPGPQVPNSQMPVVALHSIFMETSGDDFDDVEDIEDAIELMGLDEEFSSPTLHFCSAGCLVAWSSQAAAVED